MADKSSYLRYLPPTLWENEPADPQFSLGGFLRIFEKLLTGIEDGIPVTHGGHSDEPIQTTIARIHRLFDPWTVPSEFLPWLASWLELEFPLVWGEYQRRKITGEITQIYRKRGLKAGLDQFLDLYAMHDTRPRIVIDDCSKVLCVNPLPDQSAPVYTLISQGPSINHTVAFALGSLPVTDDTLVHAGMVSPLSITRGPDGSLFVGDDGTPIGWTPVVPKAVWHLTNRGEYTFAGAPSAPRRVGYASVWSPVFPVALATETTPVYHLYVLDRPGPGGWALFRFVSPSFDTVTNVATMTTLGTHWAVAMALDKNGDVLILDRGAPPGSPAAPKIIIVSGAVSGPPVTVTSRALVKVMEPLSLIVRANGDLVIGDGRAQTVAGAADLIRVDRTNNASWVESRLLWAVAAGKNPLIAPTALVEEDGTHLFVLDVGLKPLMPPLAEPYLRHMAEKAAVYRVDVGASPPVVSAASEAGELVFPTGMTRGTDGTLFISDRGEYADPTISGFLRSWRGRHQEFGVVVHFVGGNPPTAAETLLRRRIIESVRDILIREKPAHTFWTLVSAV